MSQEKLVRKKTTATFLVKNVRPRHDIDGYMQKKNTFPPSLGVVQFLVLLTRKLQI